MYTNIIYIYTYVFNYEWILKFHERIFMRFWTTSDFSMKPHVIDIDWTQWGYHFQRNPHMVHRLGWFNEWIIHFRPKRGFKRMNSFSMIWPMVFTAAKHHQTVAFPAKSANFPLTDSHISICMSPFLGCQHPSVLEDFWVRLLKLSQAIFTNRKLYIYSKMS